MGKHQRSESRAQARENVRLAISVDTLLRLRFGLPIDKNLTQPLPLDLARCVDLLRSRAGVATGSTEGYEPNALKGSTWGEPSPCSDSEK